MQTSKCQTVTGAAGSIAAALQLIEAAENGLVGETLISTSLGQAAHSLGSCAA